MSDEIMTLDEILQDPYYLEQYEQRIKIMTDGSLKAEKPTGSKMEVDMEQQTTVQPEATQPQAETVDTAAIISQAAAKAAEAAEKKTEAVFKSMLQQQGFDAEAVNAMAAEWRSKQVTPAQQLQAATEANIALQQRLDTVEQEKFALSKGVPIGAADEAVQAKVTACMTLAKSYVSADVTFEAALDKALAIISFAPQQPPVPPMYGGAGRVQVPLSTTKEEYSKMGYLEKLKLKTEHPERYKEFTSK